MDKDKSLIVSEGTQALAQINVQLGLIDKVLSSSENVFLQPKQIVLRCETVDRFEEFVVDINITELDLSEKKLQSYQLKLDNL